MIRPIAHQFFRGSEIFRVSHRKGKRPHVAFGPQLADGCPRQRLKCIGNFDSLLL
jgi:hypothetical protein